MTESKRRGEEVRYSLVGKFEDDYAPGEVYLVLAGGKQLGWLIKLLWPGVAREFFTRDGYMFFGVESRWETPIWEEPAEGHHVKLRFEAKHIDDEHQLEILRRGFHPVMSPIR